MKKPLDRISEAYFGELGDAFAEKVRSRIHWVCENAKGETILDVGCSQGITAILLGREGKKVLGIDLLEEAIYYANESLAKEEGITKDFVEFRADNFMSMDFQDQLYDTIIFGEVLEHITDPQRFILKAANMLNENGSIILTLPFGINDYFDHKKTYYLMDLLRLQNKELVVQEVKFFGKWIGAVLKKVNHQAQSVELNEDLVERLENAFFAIEKDLWKDIKNRGKKIKNLEEKVKTAQLEKDSNVSVEADVLKNKNNEFAELKDQLSIKAEQISALEKAVKEKNEEVLKMKNKEKESNKQYELMKKQAILAKKEKVQVQEELLKAYEKEEKLLVAQQKLMKKYKALSESKLGRLTLSYWSKRRSKSFGGK